MIYLGIDTGLAKAKGTMICAVENGVATWTRVLPEPNAPPLLRLQRMAGGVFQACRPEVANVTICIERPMGVMGNALPLMGLYWLIADRVAPCHHYTYTCMPQTVKLFVAGKGNADKSQVGSAAFRQWRGLLGGLEMLDADQGDSLGLALLGACARGEDPPAGEWTAYQRKACEKALRLE